MVVVEKPDDAGGEAATEAVAENTAAVASGA